MTSSSSSLSLQNAVLTLDQLLNSPSKNDGISKELERDMRVLGCELIESAGLLLELPQVAMATAQVLFQRFFYVASLKKFGIRDIALGATFLASKVEECPRNIRHIVNVFAALIDRMRGLSPRVSEYAGEMFYEFKDGLIAGELHILTKLGFNVQVQHPHGFMINYVQSLGLADDKELSQLAWNFMNDSLRTNICVCYQPSTIACAVIFLAARVCKVKLPTNPPWWEVFEANFEDLENIAGHILNLYKGPVKRDLPLTVAELELRLRQETDAESVTAATPASTNDNDIGTTNPPSPTEQELPQQQGLGGEEPPSDVQRRAGDDHGQKAKTAKLLLLPSRGIDQGQEAETATLLLLPVGGVDLQARGGGLPPDHGHEVGLRTGEGTGVGGLEVQGAGKGGERRDGKEVHR
ncbi:hypothetical protein HK104_008937 [Borealophlyctis nickersoniae]|nr:hypothetical protein HK104_008937 [Borealophlyctis nickersoniae]